MISSILSDLLPYIIAILLAGGAALGLWRGGRKAEQNKTIAKSATDMKTAIEVRNATDAKSDAAVRAELDRWVRPE